MRRNRAKSTHLILFDETFQLAMFILHSVAGGGGGKTASRPARDTRPLKPSPRHCALHCTFSPLCFAGEFECSALLRVVGSAAAVVWRAGAADPSDGSEGTN